MIDVYVSNECFELIQLRAILPFKNNGTRLSDGSWKIPIDDETVLRLARHQLKDETLSDAIYRLLSRVQ